MADYRLLSGGGVLRRADGAAIPPDPRNADWREYLAWVAAGNTADAAPQAAPTPKRLSEVLDALTPEQAAALLQAAGADPNLIA